MGYSHYYEALQCNADLAKAARQLVSASGVTICGGLGEGKPTITADEIWLNGDGSCNEEYETFHVKSPDYLVRSGWDFQCTKTGHMPYDEVICAILIWAILNESPGCSSIGSDGNIMDWHAGIMLYENVFGEISDQDIQVLVYVLGAPLGLPRPSTRWEYDGIYEYFTGADNRRALFSLMRRLHVEETLQAIAVSEAELYAEMLWGTSGQTIRPIPIDKDCSVENAVFINELTELLSNRWTQQDYEELKASIVSWDDVSKFACQHGIDEDVRSFLAGVPVKDILA